MASTVFGQSSAIGRGRDEDSPGSTTLLDFEDDTQFAHIQAGPLAKIESTSVSVMEGRRAAKMVFSAVPAGVRQYPAIVAQGDGLALRDLSPYESISFWVRNLGEADAELSLSIWDKDGNRGFPRPSRIAIRPGAWQQVVAQLSLHGLDTENIGSIHFYQNVNRQPCTLLLDHVQLLSPQAGRVAAKIQEVRGNLNRARVIAKTVGFERQVEPQIDELTRRLELLENTSRYASRGSERTRQLLELAQLASASQQLTDAATVSMQGRRITFLGPQPRSNWLANPQLVRGLEIVRLFNTSIGDDVFARLEPASRLLNLMASGKNLTGAGIERLTSDRLRILYIDGTSANDNSLQHIGKFTRLERIRLNDTDVTSGVLKHLTGLKMLTHLSLDDTVVGDSGFERIRDLRSLELLTLARTKVTGRSLVHLEPLKKLKTVDLRSTEINDAAVAHLGGMLELETLRLANTKITGASFDALASLDNLKLLDLGTTRVGDAAIRRLGAIPKLNRLELSSTRITDGCLQHITQSARLNYLDIYGTNITDAGITHLKKQRNLQQLYAGGTQTSDAGLAAIATLKRMTHLDLSGTQITDAGLRHLAGMKDLVVLRLSNTGLTGDGIRHLAGLSKLQTLDLSGTSVDDRAMASVSRFGNLRQLFLGGTRVTDAGMSKLLAKRLTQLNLEATEVGDAGIESLTALPNLRRLILDETLLTDVGMKHFSSMPRLQILSLNRTAITDAGVAQLGDGFSILYLAHTRITDGGVEHLQKNDQLTELSLAATGITDRALGLLMATPNLQQLDLSQTNISDAGLEHLTVLPELTRLNLNATRVSDVGLDTLIELTSLQRLSMENSRVSAQGASWLRHHAPSVELELVFPWRWGERWSYYTLADRGSANQWHETQTLLKQLRELTSLGYLHVDDALLTPDVLRALKDLPTLEHLSFAGSDITDEMLQHLLGLSQVARLDLSETLVTDAGLFHLEDMQGLRELNLSRTAVTGYGLQYLTELHRLQSLNLSGSRVRNAGLKHVSRLRQLRKLKLSTTRVSDAGIAHLADLPRLEYLDLFGTRFTDAGVTHLAAIRTLRYCYLSNTEITDAGVDQLRELAHIEELALDGTSLTDVGLRLIPTFINLQALRIGRNRVTVDGLQQVTRLPKLKSLSIEDLPITDAGVHSLQALSNLESLDVSGTAISDEAIPLLSSFTALKTLDVQDTAITPATINDFIHENPQIRVTSGVTRTGYSMWSILIVVTYGAVVLSICVYGVHRYWLVWRLLRDKKSRTAAKPLNQFEELPTITVQLPMFNEWRVAQRIIQAASALEYPNDRLQIQVLDDSTDESRDITRNCCAHLRHEGHNVEYLHRSNRDGFKGGALAAGMQSATGEFIALFDSDFVPRPDFLKRMIHHFTDEKIGMVQAEWSHLNRSESLLTQCQAMFLDGHFIVEQSVRSHRGLWFNFNGTAGIWRRKCIEEAGGWEHDTLTEDTDLSYRAQLAGWKFRYLPTVTCDAELPSTVTAFLGQQHRWTKGLIQNAKKLLPRILFSTAPLRVKLEAWFHLTTPVMYLVMFLLTAMALPALFLVTPLNNWNSVSLVLGLTTLGLGSFAAATFYIVSQRVQGMNLLSTFLRLPALMALGIGICAVNARAVVEALVGFRSPFVRTQKFGGHTDAALEPSPSCGGLCVPVGLMELALGGVLFGCLALSVLRPYTLVGAPFLLLFALGYAGVGLSSLLNRYGSRPVVPMPKRERGTTTVDLPQASVTWRWSPRFRRFAVTTASILVTASIAGAMLRAAANRNALDSIPPEPAELGLDLTTAAWRIGGHGGNSGESRSAIKRLHAERGSLVLDVRIDETTDEAEIVLDLKGALRRLGESTTSGKKIVFELNYPARFTGEFQAFVRDAQHHSEYGPFEVVESYNFRDTATVSLVPGPRVPPMGYKHPEFDLSSGIQQIGLKVSAQSDRVRGAGYRPFRGSITIKAISVRDLKPAASLEPRIRHPGTVETLRPTSPQQFIANSGVDSPWPFGYGFSGPLTDDHVEQLHRTYAQAARLGFTFTRIYVGDYRTGLLYDGAGQVTGVDPSFLDYLDGLAEVANEHGISVMISLTDNTMADGRGVETPEFIADRRVSTQFIKRVLVHFIERLKHRDVIWDVFNEPENVTGIPLGEIQHYVDRVIAAGRAAVPDARFTVVSRSRSEIEYWQGRGLDLYSHNIFTPQAMIESTSAPRQLDSPIMVAEIAPELATTKNLESLRQSGYIGVGIWGLNTGDKYAWMLADINEITSPIFSLNDGRD